MGLNKLNDHWNAACAAIQEVQDYSKEERRLYMADFLPPSIPTGDGKHILTTRAGMKAIFDIAKLWRSQSAVTKDRISEERIGQLAVREFGQMLFDNKLEFWTDTEAAVSQFMLRLQDRLNAAFHDVDHYFPCHVIASVEVASFDLGPIRFCKRLEWLKHIQTIAAAQHEYVEIVRRYWEDGTPLANEKTTDGMQADCIIETTGSCQWIAIVTVKGNDLGRSEERARYAVRLAIDALGLALSRIEAGKMRGPGDELRVTRTGTLSQLHGRALNTGTNVNRPRLYGHLPYAEEFMSTTLELREQAGWAIDAILHLCDEVDLFALKRRWCDALYWFGEARRDVTEFTALVRYGMCLDVLAKGGKAKGITTMLADLLDRQPGDQLLADGTSVKKVVEKIYNEGRSQLGHGGRPALLEDMPIARETVDQIVALTINNYLLNLKRYAGADDIDTFLKEIPRLVASAISTDGIQSASSSKS
jgi:hypothetical protein